VVSYTRRKPVSLLLTGELVMKAPAVVVKLMPLPACVVPTT
jgi:hypothetical protein